MAQKLFIANVQRCLLHLDDCLQSLPAKDGTITQEIQDKIDLAKRSYEHLEKLFSDGPDVIEVRGCPTSTTEQH
ncbi:MAG: hypothetical protein JSV88_01310 [Candidatus Aminicenantes bacterium]|nr:MAG: hypothetical protein JSV88_01310 [Candidatus Aminicenantes bacterium]